MGSSQYIQAPDAPYLTLDVADSPTHHKFLVAKLLRSDLPGHEEIELERVLITGFTTEHLQTWIHKWEIVATIIRGELWVRDNVLESAIDDEEPD